MDKCVGSNEHHSEFVENPSIHLIIFSGYFLKNFMNDFDDIDDSFLFQCTTILCFINMAANLKLAFFIGRF